MPEFFQRHRVISAALVLHALGLVTWVTIRVFGDNPPQVPVGTATALGAVYGLPTLAYGLWRWRSKQIEQ